MKWFPICEGAYPRISKTMERKFDREVETEFALWMEVREAERYNAKKRRK